MRFAPEATIAHIAALFEVTDGEDAVVSRLETCVADLRRVRAAKQALGQYTAAELREAFETRRTGTDTR